MQTKGSRTRTTGIEAVHSRACRTRHGDARCSCQPSWRASVWSRRDGKKVRKTFPTLAEARSWRADATVQLGRGTMRAPTQTTLRQAAEAWLSGVADGTIRKRGGEPYKPSAVRGYEAALRRRLLPELGAIRLSELRRVDLQDFADRLLRDGLDPSTVKNTLMPLRAIYRRALARGEVSVNPTTGLELPASLGRRDRIAAPSEAADLVAALPERDRALWATAFYAGLRRGELQALRWEDVDLAGGRIRVERSYDDKGAVMVPPKSAAGRRVVPLVNLLRDFLVEHKMGSGRSDGLVFGSTATRPFTPSNARRRAETAWKRANALRTADELEPLEPITLHECRHTYASLMIAAGVNAKALSTYMGHSSITITLDRYGHLMPGNEDEAAQLLEAYLGRSDTRARLAQLGLHG